MASDDVEIDHDAFHNRLSAFISQWKADKRSGDALFGGVSSIVIVMGKSEQQTNFHKNGALQVRLPTSPFYRVATVVLQKLTHSQFWLLGYEFPATLMLFTFEQLYIVTTKKKGMA